MIGSYAMDVLGAVLVALPVLGLALLLKNFFSKLSLYTGWAISLIIFGGGFYFFTWIGSHVGV